MRATYAAAFVLLLASPAFAQDEGEMSMSDVPPEAHAGAMAAMPGVEFQEVQLDLDGGQATYELSAQMDGKNVEVDVLSTGEVIEVEREISMEEVPQAVQDALNKHLSGFQPETIEHSTRTNLATMYEFEGTDSEGQAIDVEVSEDGGVVTIAQDIAA